MTVSYLQPYWNCRFSKVWLLGMPWFYRVLLGSVIFECPAATKMDPYEAWMDL